MDTPASRIIEKFGGAQAVAGIVGVHVSRVRRWAYPKARGGSDGRIPSWHQHKLLDAARSLGIDLEPADFFDLPPASDRDAA